MPFYDYPRAAVTADVALFSGAADTLQILLVRRGSDPFHGMWALPGGFVDEGERPVDAARRELAEETGVNWSGPLRQLGAYGDPGRDPRGWTVTIAWVASSSERLDVRGGDDAAEAKWHAVDALPPLAFDHGVIVADAVRALGETDDGTPPTSDS